MPGNGDYRVDNSGRGSPRITASEEFAFPNTKTLDIIVGKKPQNEPLEVVMPSATSVKCGLDFRDRKYLKVGDLVFVHVHWKNSVTTISDAVVKKITDSFIFVEDLTTKKSTVVPFYEWAEFYFVNSYQKEDMIIHLAESRQKKIRDLFVYQTKNCHLYKKRAKTLLQNKQNSKSRRTPKQQGKLVRQFKESFL